MPLNTPVVFIVFNRPELTRAVFQQIAEARPKTLLVVADGPRFPAEEARCREARAVIERVNWDCEVLTDFSDRNMGCGGRVSSGLDWAFRLCEEAIVLEDDCVPHPDFFGFCARMLDRYRHDERVMMVGGMNYLRDRMCLRESCAFSRYFAVWGWATWRRAWEKYDIAMAQWPALKSQRQLQSLFGRGEFSRYLERLFDSAANTDTWDIQWVYSCVFQNGLSIVPPVNLIKNIGVVGAHATGADGSHGLPTFALPPGDTAHPGLVFPNALYDDALAQEILRPLAPTPLQRAAARLPPGTKRRLRDILRRLRAVRPAGGPS